MKFYVVQGDSGVAGCELSLAKAKRVIVAQYGSLKNSAVDGVVIRLVSCEVSSETIRRVLGRHGGYCSDVVQVWPIEEAAK